MLKTQVIVLNSYHFLIILLHFIICVYCICLVGKL